MQLCLNQIQDIKHLKRKDTYNMPMVNGKKYPYTKKGKMAAKKAAKKKGKKVKYKKGY